MIPLTLRVRNFMSYGDAPIEVDFGGLHLACLSGGNGHGKSALLDAMTWVLWGRSRARREDDLVRQGATEMEVELCFAEGTGHYRVLRKRTLRKSGGTAALELQALGEGGYASITGATIAETQARLNDILKLGYDTFINSSFLLQGRADEFTVKPPAQRKAVLGEILGLERYDRLAERGRERARTLAAKAAALRDGLKIVQDELARRPALREELAEVTGRRDVAAQALREAELGLGAALADRQRLATSEEALDRVEGEIVQLQTEIAALQKRHDAAAAIVRDADEVLAREDAIMAGVAELRLVRAAAEEMGARAGLAMEAEREVARVRQEIEQEAAHLRSVLTSAAENESQYLKVAGQEPTLRHQVEEHELAEARIPTVEAERATLAADAQTLRGEIAALQSENERLTAEMEPLRQRLKLLKEPGAACPVCGAPMDEAERKRVYKQFTDEGVAKDTRRKDNDARILALQRRISELDERDRALATTLAGLHRLARESGKLRQLLQHAEEARDAAAAARARADVARLALDREDYAQEARARLAVALAAAQAIGYDRAEHDALRLRAHELAPFEQAASELATARERRAAALSAMADTTEDLARRNAQAAQAEEAAVGLRLVLEALPQVEQRLTACEAAVKESRLRVEQEERLVMGLTERLRGLDEQEERLRDRRAELARLERESDAYAELGRIFGKAGIQAMIIDNALPELETSANEILSRMSDGAMQVRFDTQKAGTRGDVLETLDISIADASGTRPYEMFSGGEAFRVNFAVRIALSRLLAARAGAQLQLLVIDEGFGTQDGQGRDRLVDAINTIAPDFEKIMVITHIDELKDLFDVRLDVVKGRDGSRVVVTAN